MLGHEFLSPDESSGLKGRKSRKTVVDALQGQQSAETPPSPEAAREHKDPYSLIEEAVPKSSYGLESVGLKTAEFLTKLAAAIAAGELDRFLQSAAITPEAVYAVLQSESPDDASGSKVYSHHQPAALENQIKQLEAVADQLTPSNYPDMPVAIMKAYQKAVEEKLRHARAMMELGKPEFTKLHRSPREWGELLGDNKDPRARLPFAEIAEKMLLDSNLGVEATKDDVHKNVGEALKIFNISETELATIGITPDLEKLTSEQGQELFRFLLSRLGFNTWTVEPSNGAAINVMAAGRTVSFPKSRELLASELRFITAHEFVHIIRGENGSKQPYRLLQSGNPGYLKTEEGLATLVEMIVGEKTSHERMRKLAARYVGVDMATQVEFDDDGQPLKAKYSPQQIYEALTEKYGVSAKDAADIVWRIFRNTSLRQELVTVTAQDANGETWQRVIPEVFPKDAIYFEGLRHMFEWIKTLFPDNAIFINFLRRQSDFNELALFAIGRMLEEGLNDGPQLPKLPGDVESEPAASHQEQLEKNGLSYLLQLLEFWMVGKIDFDADGNKEWGAALNPADTRYGQLFQGFR